VPFLFRIIRTTIEASLEVLGDLTVDFNYLFLVAAINGLSVFVFCYHNLYENVYDYDSTKHVPLGLQNGISNDVAVTDSSVAVTDGSVAVTGNNVTQKRLSAKQIA